jgi:DNA uptake protein ComE-like DNA-binding protein
MWKVWWKNIKDYFRFHPQEKRGIMVLFGLIILLLTFNHFRAFFFSADDDFSFETKTIFREKAYDTKSCLDFNSDSLKLTEFPNLIHAIKQERRKFGNFYCLEDLLDVRGIKQYHLDYWIQYSEPEFINRKYLNLNTASVKAIQQYFRISQKHAQRVVNFRELIGGYAHFSQLELVYYFPKKRLLKNRKKRIILSAKEIETINWQSLSIKQLAKHPFISKQEAKKIVEDRNRGNTPNFQKIFANSKHKAYISSYLKND